MIFHAVISRYTAQAHYPCSYSNRPNFSIFLVLQLPSSGVPYSLSCSTGLEWLLKYQLGVWVALTTNFMAVSYPSSSTNYSSEDI